MFDREACESPLDGAGQIAQLGLPVGCGPLITDFRCSLESPGGIKTAPPPVADGIERQVPRDTEDYGGELRLGRQPPEMAVQPDEGLLRQVFGVLGLIQHTGAEVDERALIAPHEFGEGRHVPCLRPRNEFPIVHVLHAPDYLSVVPLNTVK